MVAPEQAGTAVLAGLIGAVAVVIWWLFFSRAIWLERLGAIAVMAFALAITSRLVHESIANGMMGFMLFVYGAPILSLALVSWAAASRGFPAPLRRASMAAVILIACGSLTLVRTNGLTGNADSDFEWRWTPTAEQRLLELVRDERTDPPAGGAIASPPQDRTLVRPDEISAAPLHVPPATHPVPERVDAGVPAIASTAAVWPGFRGAARDSVVRGVRIETDWSRTPPIELWRRPIGPGWSSFAVAGHLVFTQEQRGEDEMVTAYNLNSGEPVWTHRDSARFWESNAGAGPRATPTFSNDRLYTLGATGILNALDARNGAVIWSRNAATDTGSEVPPWGIASSPLVVGDAVIAATAGSLAAYDIVTGEPRWIGPKNGWGYSSPQLATIDGIAQVVLVNGPGVIGVAPSDGKLLWQYAWGGDSIVQPAVLADGGLLIGSGSGLADNSGVLRINIAHEPGGWIARQRWTTTGLKPYFNDFLVHQGHAFGFDGSILSCIDLADGTRKWKGGRYGHGQAVLLPDQDLLLVLSEDGELALVSATPDKFTEIARIPGIEGKTWNHPVLAGDVLLVRNGQEMAAFRLTLSRR